MDDQNIVESKEIPKKSPKYNTLLEVFSDIKNLTVRNNAVIFFLFLVWLAFLWFFINTFNTRSIGDLGGIVLILMLFSYSLFLSLKNKFKKRTVPKE